jgi:hypothetical protein
MSPPSLSTQSEHSTNPQYRSNRPQIAARGSRARHPVAAPYAGTHPARSDRLETPDSPDTAGPSHAGTLGKLHPGPKDGPAQHDSIPLKALRHSAIDSHRPDAMAAA